MCKMYIGIYISPKGVYGLISRPHLCFPSPPCPLRPQVKYTATREAEAAAQLAWIDRTLNASRAHYLFVVGHYPVYSTAEHGDTHELVRDLEPLLYVDSGIHPSTSDASRRIASCYLKTVVMNHRIHGVRLEVLFPLMMA